MIEEWKKWNLAGFIPGSDENEMELRERVRFCQNLKQEFFQQEGDELPFNLNESTHYFIKEAIPKTEELYGICPTWVLLFFSNFQLTPWHGGCAWIFQLNENTPTAAFLQLRKHFQVSPSYLGLYQRKELIIHELAHVGRMQYQEPQFEEILAYQSSSSKWRRFLGPIVQSSSESLIFLLVLGIVVIADIALLMGNGAVWSPFLAWIKSIPLFLVFLAIGRLFFRQRAYRNCLKNLESFLTPKDARHLAYRLLDKEIRLFAKSSSSEIRNFIEKTKEHSFRWQFLDTLYPRSRQ